MQARHILICYKGASRCEKETSKEDAKKQIDELTEFSRIFGAKPLVGARFNNTEWLFLKIEDLKKSKTGNNFVVDINLAKDKGITFNELIRKE